MTIKHDNVVELLREWVRGTRADGIGPLGTSLKDLEEIADMVKAELETEREKAALLEAECDKLNAKVDDFDELLDDYDCETYHGGTIVDWYEFSVRLHDDLENTIAERDRCYMELPVDADGVPIRVGDVLEDAKFNRISLVVDGYTSELKDGKGPIHPTTSSQGRYESEWFRENEYRHVKPETVEDIIAEAMSFACEPESPYSKNSKYVQMYAERIRKAVEK